MAAIDFPSNPTAYPVESPWTDPLGNRWYYTASKLKWALLGVTNIIDTTVIDGSTNPVSGNAVFDAITAKNALATPFTPVGSIAATNVQAAIVELDGDVTGLSANLTTVNAAATQAELERQFNLRKAYPISQTQGPNQDNSAFPDGVSTTTMLKNPFQAPSYAINRLRLLYQNAHFTLNGVVLNTKKLVFRASVEYPAGVMTPVFFNGKRDCELEMLGFVTSSVVAVNIPANAVYWVRTFTVIPGGFLTEIRSVGGWQGDGTESGTGYAQVGVGGAAATASLGITAGRITSITLTSGGSGYPTNSEVNCSISGTGSGGIIKAVIGPSGCIENFRIDSGGSGYSAPTVSIPGNVTGLATYNGIPVDSTTAGTVPESIRFGGYCPSVIIATPSNEKPYRSYIAIGDSITASYYDSTMSGGWASRASKDYQVPITNVSFSGGSLYQTYPPASPVWKILELARNHTDAIIFLGVNDLQDGQTDVQIKLKYTTMIRRLQSAGLNVSVCTITPITSNADIPKTYENYRVSVNEWLRTMPEGVITCFETADTLETSRNSGLWKPGVFHAESMKLHPNGPGFDLLKTAFSAILK